MPEDIRLSAAFVPGATGVQRDCPRPPALRNATFAERFDWSTLFYDVYRVEKDVVFQGPPFFNFLNLLKQAAPFDRAFSGLFPKARHIAAKKRGEIWLRSEAERFTLDGALGHHEITVQPDEAQRFAGRRVLLAISKNNDPAWIADWLRFYTRIHGAEALLLYDNGSTDYDWRDLQTRLRSEFPETQIVIVPWHFPYGPSGGLAGAVDGVEAPWDSDFCQTGMFQHARFRFLRKARSVLDIDIDELVLSNKGRSVFEAAETSRQRFVKFQGFWITATTLANLPPEGARHADFSLRDTSDPTICPAKWCMVPARSCRTKHSWSVHNLFGARCNTQISKEFAFRHMRGISKGWKEKRWDATEYDPGRFEEDLALREAFANAGMSGRLETQPTPLSAR